MLRARHRNVLHDDGRLHSSTACLLDHVVERPVVSPMPTSSASWTPTACRNVPVAAAYGSWKSPWTPALRITGHPAGYAGQQQPFGQCTVRSGSAHGHVVTARPRSMVLC